MGAPQVCACARGPVSVLACGEIFIFLHAQAMCLWVWLGFRLCQVPKTIGFFLVRQLQEKLQFEIYNQLNDEKHFSELLGEVRVFASLLSGLTGQTCLHGCLIHFVFPASYTERKEPFLFFFLHCRLGSNRYDPIGLQTQIVLQCTGNERSRELASLPPAVVMYTVKKSPSRCSQDHDQQSSTSSDLSPSVFSLVSLHVRCLALFTCGRAFVSTNKLAAWQDMKRWTGGLIPGTHSADGVLLSGLSACCIFFCTSDAAVCPHVEACLSLRVGFCPCVLACGSRLISWRSVEHSARSSPPSREPRRCCRGTPPLRL